MGAWNLLIVGVCMGFMGITVRNLLGGPTRIGVLLGRVAMVGFAALAAWFFWKAREFGDRPVPGEALASAQRMMVASAVAMMLAACGVGVQRRKRARQDATAPAPSTSDPRPPSPPATS